MSRASQPRPELIASACDRQTTFHRRTHRSATHVGASTRHTPRGEEALTGRASVLRFAPDAWRRFAYQRQHEEFRAGRRLGGSARGQRRLLARAGGPAHGKPQVAVVRNNHTQLRRTFPRRRGATSALVLPHASRAAGGPAQTPLKREDLTCGAKGTRTPGLLVANQTLFQLSYSPEMSSAQGTRCPAVGAQCLLSLSF